MINAEYRSIDKRKISINDSELSARLGRVCSHQDEELFRVYETLMRTIEPRYAVSRVTLNYPEENKIDLGFTTVTSSALAKNLSGCTEAFVFVCTLGGEVDRLIGKLSKTSRAEAFIFDAVASALAEAAADAAEEEIKGERKCRTRFSPGYADLSLACQGALLDFLGAPVYLGVAIGESGLMSPLKTVSAVMGIIG